MLHRPFDQTIFYLGMVGEGMDAANAGFEVGYGSPSQFSRDYARLFGCPPASHAARLRTVAGLARCP